MSICRKKKLLSDWKMHITTTVKFLFTTTQKSQVFQIAFKQVNRNSISKIVIIKTKHYFGI